MKHLVPTMTFALLAGLTGCRDEAKPSAEIADTTVVTATMLWLESVARDDDSIVQVMSLDTSAMWAARLLREELPNTPSEGMFHNVRVLSIHGDTAFVVVDLRGSPRGIGARLVAVGNEWKVEMAAFEHTH